MPAKPTVGASQSWALTGRSEWDTPVTLFHKLRGDLPPEPEPTPFDRAHLYFGTASEPMVRAAAKDHLGLHYIGPQNTRRVNRFLPWVHARPDSIVTGDSDKLECLFEEHGLSKPPGDGVLELKTSTAFIRRDQWQPIPDAYHWQVAHQCAVIGCEWGVVAALIGNREFRLVPVVPTLNVRNAVITLCKNFAENYLWPGIAPPVDGSNACSEILAKLYPSDNGESIELSPDQQAWVDAYNMASKQMKEAENMKREAANHIKDLMKDATEATCFGGKFTWREQEVNRKAQAARSYKTRPFRFWPETS